MSTQQEINVDEQVKAQTKILADLEDFENKGVMTKKEYILKLKDVTRPLVLADYYPDTKLNDLCSLIGEMLGKYNIEYSSGHLAELFDDHEKRIQHNPKQNSPDGGVITSPPLQQEQGIIGQLDFLEKQIGKSYDVMQDDEAADKLQTLENIAAKSVSHIKTFEKNYKTASYFVSQFEKTFGSSDEADKILESLPKKQRDRMTDLITKYHANILLISETHSELANTTDENIKELQATQAMVSRDIDQRNKLSNWEKLMIVLAMKAEGIAKNQCAKLNGIDKKHITNNIYPEISPTETKTKNKHHEYISWFKCIKIGDKTFDIARWFDEQIERKKLSLEFKPMVVTTARVE